ncbi:MAG: hypothetical protein IJ264_06015 [Clostridia bacterium]|nr:hypothetical protein [Clostridia bacterium]
MKKMFSVLSALIFLFLVSCGREDTISTSSQNFSEDYSSPEIIITSFNDLKEIKFALNTMDSASFISYMHENYSNLVLNGMRDSETTRNLLEELETTTILLLKGSSVLDDDFSFYHKRNEVHQLVFFDENSRVSAYNYTPQSGRDENSAFGVNNEKAVLIEELNCNGVSVFVYKTDSEETYFADAFANDTYIFMRTKDIKTIEDIESCFSRLEFVKIGDLLNETEKMESEATFVRVEEITNQKFAMLSEEKLLEEQTNGRTNQ